MAAGYTSTSYPFLHPRSGCLHLVVCQQPDDSLNANHGVTDVTAVGS